MDVRIRQEALDAIVAHARRASPQECCGLLIGDGTCVLEAVALENAAAEPFRRYEISPEDYFAQIRRCRETTARGEASLAVVGAYHSHPRSAPAPSPTDREEAFEDFLYLITGPVEGPDPSTTRAYRLESGNFREVALVPLPQEPTR